ncbi:MAG TPA: hypothetical protein VM686_00500 [Polyangiaceae bacterium]|nr:hypothetical protein [Polyangiaceae bacterium]
MTTRIESGGPSTTISSGPTAYRTTAVPHRPFQSVMSAGASAVVGGAEAAVSALPGGPILAASFRSGASVQSAPVQTPTGAASSGADPASGGSTEGSMEQTLAQSADQNMYFLQLQEQMAAENRHYSALSNVLKARHETVKNAIGNIR